jgi:hypothetical protein
MAHRKVYPTQSLLDVIWVYLVYLEARLLRDANTKDLVSKVTSLLDRVEAAAKAQRDKFRSIINSQAGVDLQNFFLDKNVIRFSRVLLNTEEIDHNINHAHYKLYYTMSASRVEKLALEAEVKVVRPWLASLKNETDPAVLAFASIFEGDLNAADIVLKELEDAKTARQGQRVREIIPLVRDINDTCKEIFGTLTARAPSLKMPEEWPDNFFYKSRRNNKPDDPAEAYRVALYSIFDAHELEVSEDVDTKIQEEKNTTTLDKWLIKAATAKTPEEAVGLSVPAEA